MDNISAIRAFKRIEPLDNSVFNEVAEPTDDKTKAFGALLDSAIEMINETNAYTDAAEEAEMSYALGINTNTHDLQVAQMKATISLQYTVAVRNAVMDAYKEIMQISF